MLTALLIICIPWLGLYGLCHELRARGQLHPDVGIAWILSSAGWSVLLVAIVEVTSAFQALNRATVAGAWVLAGLVLAGAALWLRWRRGGFAGLFVRMRESARRVLAVRPLDALVLQAVVGLGVAALGFVALATATTNWDSMTYHLPRIMHWLQQQSVAHFATPDARQLESGPWSEFVIATLYLLAGSDRLANLPQWYAMLCSLFAAALIARQLYPGWNQGSGAAAPDRARISAITALLVLTIPIGVTEAVSTQNDYVTACWLVCFVALGLALAANPTNPWYLAGCGAALALGMLTKATMIVFAAPFAVALLLGLAWRLPGIWLKLRAVLLIGALIALINAPHMLRNYAIYQSPLGSRWTFEIQRNLDISIGGMASNIIRNLALHSQTGIAPLTDQLQAALTALHTATGRPLGNEANTFPYTPFQFPQGWVFSDSTGSAFWHLVLVPVLLLGLGVLVLRSTIAPRRAGLYYAYCGLVCAGFVLFCGYLRWNPWHSRFHLAQLLLLMPLAALVLVQAWPRLLSYAYVAVLFGIAVYAFLYNQSRPLYLGRAYLTKPHTEQMFILNQLQYPLYQQLADDLIASKCLAIGKFVDSEVWQYPLWLMLKERGFTGTIENVLVQNETSVLRAAEPRTCAVFTSVAGGGGLGARYHHATTYSAFTVYWDERSSEWSSLKSIASDAQVAVVQPGQVFQLGQAPLQLRFRSGREGLLHLLGTLKAQGDAPLKQGVVTITAANGYSEAVPISGPAFESTIPIAGGATAIDLAFSASTLSAQATLSDLRWEWRPGGGAWAVIQKLQNSNGLETLDGQPFFWMGDAPTSLQVFAGQAGQLELRGTFILGPSLAGVSSRQVLIENGYGYQEIIQLAAGEQRLALPVVAGQNTITLTALDRPNQATLPNGDTRTLLLGVKKLSAQLLP